VIYGVGTDILRFDRIVSTYERFGEHFVRRLLMPRELSLFDPDDRPERFLAMRFAAKEAIVKAMGTGFANGMWVRDAGVIPDPLGRPQMVFSDRGARLCRRLGIGGGHLSLSDEAGLVIAVAVLECRVDDRGGETDG